MGRRAGGGRSGINRLHRRKQVVRRRGTNQRNSHRRGNAVQKKHRPTNRGARHSRRRDHVRMRRRFLGGHGGGAAGAADLAFDELFLGEDPFADADALLEELNTNDMLGESQTIAELLPGFYEDTGHGSESEAEGSDDGEAMAEGPPPLASDEHYHVFVYHSSNQEEDQENVKDFVETIEDSPYDLRAMISDKDFKPDLSTIENIQMALELCQKVVLICSYEFVISEAPIFNEATASLTEDEKKKRIVLILMDDVELPPYLQTIPEHYQFTDIEFNIDQIAKFLSSGPVPKGAGASGLNKLTTEPSAPPQSSLSGNISPQAETTTTLQNPNIPQPRLNEQDYKNGEIIETLMAGKYRAFEHQQESVFGNLDRIASPCYELVCQTKEPTYRVPPSLTKRGLQITVEEFTDILHSLSEASNVTFFQKSVDCSVSCLLVSAVSTVTALAVLTWFLIAGCLMNDKMVEEVHRSSIIFWTFMVLIVFIPTLCALISLCVIAHLTNYKYLKYRIKVEELNKRFRETHLVLHCRPPYWKCSSKIRLDLIYYDFEQCQQNLYCHVHDEINIGFRSQNEFNNNFCSTESTTQQLDKIMKRVNTLTRKFEWSYFEHLVRRKLPPVTQNVHRIQGMCFCQYILYQESMSSQIGWLKTAKSTIGGLRQNAFSKSHRSRRDCRSARRSFVYEGPVANHNGTAHFIHDLSTV